MIPSSHHDHLSDPCQLLRAGGDALLAGTKLSWNNGDYGNSTLPPPVPGPNMMGMNGARSSSGAGGAGGMYAPPPPPPGAHGAPPPLGYDGYSNDYHQPYYPPPAPPQPSKPPPTHGVNGNDPCCYRSYYFRTGGSFSTTSNTSSASSNK